jgi:hypothetical protein
MLLRWQVEPLLLGSLVYPDAANDSFPCCEYEEIHILGWCTSDVSYSARSHSVVASKTVGHLDTSTQCGPHVLARDKVGQSPLMQTDVAIEKLVEAV